MNVYYCWTSTSVTVFVLFVLGTATCGPPFKNINNPWWVEIKQTIKAVEKGLKYFRERPEIVTDDVTLGVLIAKANLEWIIGSLRRYFEQNLPLSNSLEKLIGQCDDIIELHEPKSLPILNKGFWKDAAGDLKYGALGLRDDKFVLPKFDSCQSVDEYLMKEAPEDSDFCLNELITASCNVSDNCWFSAVGGGFRSGYKTTHRLLYFQAASQLKCEKTSPRFSGIGAIKNNLCQEILPEAEALFQEPHISLTQDLFMEQIALCGLEGYEEFAPKIWRDALRNWQSREGCYGKGINLKSCSLNATTEWKREKRRDTLVGDCHTHVTAVAISAMSFFLRFILNVTFRLS